VGPITFYQLLRRFKTASAALKQVPRIALRAGRGRALNIPDDHTLDSMLHLCAQKNVYLLAQCESGYPDFLRSLDDAPPLLAVRGRAALLKKPMLSIVGSRNASALGQRLAFEWALELSAAGEVIVSGFAQGVDTSAHRGSLRNGTIAVFAGGVDTVYPPENEHLYNALCEQGAIISEMPLGTPVNTSLFPRRNRLISGLSWGVVVIEAAGKSGSLLTAHYANKQGRHVMAVPGHPQDPRSEGTSQLIRDGATLVRTPTDVLDERPPKRHVTEASPFELVSFPSDIAIDAVRTDLLRVLSPTATPLQDLCKTTNAPPEVVRAALVELSLAGRAMLHFEGGMMASFVSTVDMAS
jgi:DNA processing protein